MTVPGVAVFLVLHDHHFEPFFLTPAREVRAGQVQGEMRVEVEHPVLVHKGASVICE